MTNDVLHVTSSQRLDKERSRQCTLFAHRLHVRWARCWASTDGGHRGYALGPVQIQGDAFTPHKCHLAKP
jgi:hypothetical protein